MDDLTLVPGMALADLEMNLDRYVVRLDCGYNCNLCGKHCLDRTAARNHVEALHFPTKGHNCRLCGKFMKTKNALNNHMYRYHKN